MPTKSTKKTVKKAPAKKTVKSAPTAAPKPVMTEIAEPTHCCCSCTKRKKFIYLVCAFILGILFAQLFCFCNYGHYKPSSHAKFINGCVDMSSIQATMDINKDGCVSANELHAVKIHARRHHKKAVAQPDVNVENAIAPVME